MINPKLLSDGELIACLQEMRKRDADVLRAIYPAEPTEEAAARSQIASKILTKVVGLDLTNLERARVASEDAADAVRRLLRGEKLADVIKAERDAAMQIVREEWHRAVMKFRIESGSPTEEVTARIIERLNARDDVKES